MAQLNTLDDAQTLVLATLLATESDLNRLQILAAESQDILDRTLLLRILLTYLPANAENQDLLADFLEHVLQDFQDVSTLDTTIDTSAVTGLSPHEVSSRIHEIRLKQLSLPPQHDAGDIGGFLIQWVQQLEATSGLTSRTRNLVSKFAHDESELGHWRDACLVPLVLLQNELYPGKSDILTLEGMESLHGQSGVHALLQFAEQDGDKAEIGRDLSIVVSPWVRGAQSWKRRRLEPIRANAQVTTWQDIDDWIYTTSGKNYTLSAKAILEWDGPPQETSDDKTEEGGLENPRVHFIRTTLSLIAKSTASSSKNDELLHQLLERAVSLSVALPTPLKSTDRAMLASATRTDLLEPHLLSTQNPLTSPSEDVFGFWSQCLLTKKIMQSLQLDTDVPTIAEISLFGSEDKQKHEVGRILRQVPQLTKLGIEWRQVRTHLFSLRTIQSTTELSSDAFSLLGRVPIDYIESEFLDAILLANQYSLVKEIYLDAPQLPLSKDQVRDHIVQAVLNAYDNATNGNRTRGGIKRASELLSAFQPSFPQSEVFSDIDHLIKATHSLSFYQLTLQHGVPFKPVNIRVFEDPLGLIEKVLAQNAKAYTKLDDLLEVGRNLIGARSAVNQKPDSSPKLLGEQVLDAEHRITFLAITSALSDHDFDTAYSYLTTRLSMNPSQASSTQYMDDTSWRAAYAAGKYQPTTSPKSLHDRINSLSKRMDLLSLALTLAPTPEPLPEILATWRRSEEQMESLKLQAIEEERAHEARSDGTIPGGFGPGEQEVDAAETKRLMDKRGGGGFSATYEEEAPMGLFDVARGAASAFRKSAFPLNRSLGAERTDRSVGWSQLTSTEKSPSTEYADHTEGQAKTRRKRDVVSGIVTGGLVSGMSWVLGAPPTNQQEQHQNQ